MFKKINKFTAIVIIICMLFVALIGGLIHHMHQYTEREYQLYEIENEVYAIYYTTHSDVPADNYEVITLCCGGNICTFEGHVSISFTNENPYVKVKNYNMVNADEIYVYVPQGTVSYAENIGM